MTSPENMGSYDFASYLHPNHTIMDINPWVAWGNSPQDSTTPQQRYNAVHSGVIGKMQSFLEGFYY